MAYIQWISPQAQIAVNEIVRERIEEKLDPELALERGHERARRSYERQGKSAEWIERRARTVPTRKTFTSVLGRHGVEGEGFRHCTNAIYKPTIGQTAQERREAESLPAKAVVRDHLSVFELETVQFAEALATEKIRREQSYGNHACVRTCNEAGKIVGNATRQFLNQGGGRESR